MILGRRIYNANAYCRLHLKGKRGNHMAVGKIHRKPPIGTLPEYQSQKRFSFCRVDWTVESIFAVFASYGIEAPHCRAS